MAKVFLYPPNPDEVPDDLTEPSSQYKTQTFMMLLSLMLFFMLYFGLMFFCVVYGLWALFLCPFEPRPGSSIPWPLIKLVALVLIIPTFVLFIYMVKNLF